MKTSVPLIACLLASGFIGQAMAQSACPAGTPVRNVKELVGGKTLCAARGNERWQEQHRGGPDSGELWDYKRGPGHATDPTARVGSWSATNGANSSLTHTYGSNSYSWRVCQTGATYSLVSTGSGGNITGVTFLSSPSCP